MAKGDEDLRHVWRAPPDSDAYVARKSLRRIRDRSTDELMEIARDRDAFPWWRKARVLLRERGFTIRQLSEASNLPYRSLVRWLDPDYDREMWGGVVKGEIRVATRIAACLQVPWWWFLDLDTSPPCAESTCRLGEAWDRLQVLTRGTSRRGFAGTVLDEMSRIAEVAIEAIESRERGDRAIREAANSSANSSAGEAGPTETGKSGQPEARNGKS